MALLTLCLFPLIQSHAGMRRAERGQLAQMQLTLLAQEAFCLLKVELYENTITWAALETGCQGKLDHEFSVALGKNANKTLHCHYTIMKQNLVTKQNKQGLVVVVDLHFLPGNYHFERTLYLEKHSA